MKEKIQIPIFVILTFFSTLLLILSKNIYVSAFSQATPAFAVLLLILLFKSKRIEITNLGLFRIGNIKWYFLAIIVPFSAIAFAYLAADAFSLVSFFPWNGMLNSPTGMAWFFSFFYKYVKYIFLWPLIWAVGEEIAWRGYLQPKLTKLFGLRKAIFFTGIIWALWHYIFIFSGDYYTSGNTTINTILFTLTVILMSFSIGWIREVSQSIWPCVIFHSASNAAWQMWSYQFKVMNSNYIYVAGEAGIVNILFWGVCFYFVMKTIGHSNEMGQGYKLA
jgi:uncharacterized protein